MRHKRNIKAHVNTRTLFIFLPLYQSSTGCPGFKAFPLRLCRRVDRKGTPPSGMRMLPSRIPFGRTETSLSVIVPSSSSQTAMLPSIRLLSVFSSFTLAVPVESVRRRFYYHCPVSVGASISASFFHPFSAWSRDRAVAGSAEITISLGRTYPETPLLEYLLPWCPA